MPGPRQTLICIGSLGLCPGAKSSMAPYLLVSEPHSNRPAKVKPVTTMFNPGLYHSSAHAALGDRIITPDYDGACLIKGEISLVSRRSSQDRPEA